MKTARKVLLLVLCAALLVSATVMGTLAYLADEETVTNTFTVGKVELGGGDYEYGLDEAKTDENGDATTPAERVQANNYKLQPGHNYTKDPTIHVAPDSEDCYLFVKVENGIADIEAADNNIEAQMAAKGWLKLGTGYDNMWVYVGTADGASDPLAVKAKANVVVFEEFTVDNDLDNDDLKDYEDAEIVITAYAIQADGFDGKTAVEIWNALNGQLT